MKQSSSVSHVNQWREHLHYRLKEVVLIALAALCLYLLMALLSYDPSDPGWTHTSRIDQVHNTGGPRRRLAGRRAVHGARLFRLRVPRPARRQDLADLPQAAPALGVERLAVFLAADRSRPAGDLGFGTGLCPFHAVSALPASAGGALGESLGQLSVAALNVQGSTLLFLALFLLGLTVFTDLSWFKVMDFTGKVVLDLLDLVEPAALKV